ncbi:MAG: ribonuclease R family protein [Chlamydiales bacterium]
MKKKTNIVTGNIRVHPRGFGFLKGEKEIFIPKKWIEDAVDGDEVDVEIVSTSERGPEGRVKKIVKRGRSLVAGTIAVLYGKRKMPYAFVPLLHTDELMRIDTKKGEKLKEGDRILIRVTDWGSKRREPSGEPDAFLGHISDPSCDVSAAIEEYELENDFPKQVIAEAKAFGKEVQGLDGRRDLRDLECFTIDPKTARDFDDALHLIQNEEGNYHLGVHIADVSHYVKPGTALDAEARKRCNSTYLPGTVVPMLPHELSSHLCSLMPKVDRFTLSVLITMDKEANLLDYEIVRSCIHSKKRFSYEEAKEVLDGKKRCVHKKSLDLMVQLCHALKKKRAERGSIEFALPDIVIPLDKKGMPTGVEIVEYDITHQLVEEFMLKANEIVATHLSKLGKPLTYRVHGEPFEENLREFAATATALGFPLSAAPTAEELQEFFDHVRETALGKLFATSFIRCMKLAEYSTENIGHYGLGLEHYTHFTSPIRRYVDLIVHRLLMEEVVDEDLEEIAQLCSEKERHSAKAENRVLFLKKLRLLQKRAETEKTFSAIITKVKPFGFTFEVTDFLLEGFLPISNFKEFFHYDEESASFKTKDVQFRAGNKIEIFPTEIDLITSEVLWELN